MGYINIQNLYANKDILLFKECYALEKIHGSSAHISFNLSEPNKINYHVGGEKNAKFVALFDQQKLLEVFPNFGVSKIVVFGEAYGGAMQHMSHTYGKELKFVVFDVKMDDNWLNMPNAESVAKALGLEFVHYEKISTKLEEIDKQRDADSVQAVRNGMGTGHKREGVVLRPLIELTKNNGERVCSKHKTRDFCETATERKVDNPEKLKILEDAEAIANEWVTYMRLQHVLDKIPGHNMSKTGEIVIAMIEDVIREGKNEIIDSRAARRAIGTKAAVMYKDMLKRQLKENA